MDPFPHMYTASLTCTSGQPITIDSPGLPALSTAPPAEFDGPGNLWSPETLLLASVGDCFALTFRAVATASKLNWHRLDCSVRGVLDRVDGTTRFVEIYVDATLQVPAGVNEATATRILEKAEQNCLVSNSLNIRPVLQSQVEITED